MRKPTMVLWCPDCNEYKWSKIVTNPLVPDVRYKVCMVCGCRTRIRS